MTTPDHNSEHSLVQTATWLGFTTKIFGNFDAIRDTTYNFTFYDNHTICSAPPHVLNEDEIEQFRCCCYKPLHKYGYYGCCHYTSSSTFKMSLSISPKWLFTCTMYVLYGSAVSFMRGKLKLLFLLGDNNGPTSSITILKITYKIAWCLVGITTFKEILARCLTFNFSWSNSWYLYIFFPWNPHL